MYAPIRRSKIDCKFRDFLRGAAIVGTYIYCVLPTENEYCRLICNEIKFKTLTALRCLIFKVYVRYIYTDQIYFTNIYHTIRSMNL